jgi:hypothetical protein
MRRIETIDSAIGALFVMLFLLGWLAGIVVANGLLQKVFTLVFPPYSWYVLVEKIFQVTGFI